MQTSKTLKERTQWAIEYIAQTNKLTNTGIGKAVGSKPDTVRKYRSKTATPRINFLNRFSEVYGIDFQWITKGTGAPFPGKNIQYRKSSLPNEAPGFWDIDGEMSFQKLALLAGIRIDDKWVLNLSEAFGIEPWRIDLTIRNKRIDNELIDIIENQGYKRYQWLVGRDSEKSGPIDSDSGISTTSQLLQMAEDVLRSNTIQSTFLAMNIISSKEASEKKGSLPILGANAINLPKKLSDGFK